MFEARSVALRYGSRPVLAETSLALRPGELTVVVGPNGAGKTSLLRILSGEIAPTCGEVRVGERALRALKPRELAASRAVLPQSSHLAFPFTVLEVVRLGILPGSGRDAGRLALAMLDKVDLGGFADRYFQQLSGGEKQRVHLARVLCQLESSPRRAGEKVLFLDEPVSSLDIGHQVRIMEIAREACTQGSGVLAILHDLNLAALFADRIVLMRAGSVLAEGSPREVITEERIERGFGIRALVNVPPVPPRPYVLPQSCNTVP